jgi:uncharacterized protein YbjT (DUF2867 family)
MRVILTGVTGMVGEGVLLECLESPDVEKVLSVSRKPTKHEHPKLEQLIVPDFRNLAEVEARLTGYDGCFYCAGVSSVGMSEADYTVVSYDTPVEFATTLARLNPSMVFTYVTGARTDSTEKGRTMWARVKGRAENALMQLPFKGVYNFRPGLMTPKKGQKHVKKLFRVARGLARDEAVPPRVDARPGGTGNASLREERRAEANTRGARHRGTRRVVMQPIWGKLAPS